MFSVVFWKSFPYTLHTHTLCVYVFILCIKHYKHQSNNTIMIIKCYSSFSKSPCDYKYMCNGPQAIRKIWWMCAYLFLNYRARALLSLCVCMKNSFFCPGIFHPWLQLSTFFVWFCFFLSECLNNTRPHKCDLCVFIQVRFCAYSCCQFSSQKLEFLLDIPTVIIMAKHRRMVRAIWNYKTKQNETKKCHSLIIDVVNYL